MNARQIETYLQELGDELAARGFRRPVRVTIVGGVFMLVNVKNRVSTEDVDIILMDIDSMSYTPLPEETRKFRAAVWAIAGRKGIPRSWLNDDSSLFITSYITNTGARLWKRFNKLEVYFPTKEAVLAMKIIAFRDKDQEDIAALCKQLRIKTRVEAQAIIDRFVTDEGQKENLVARTLNRLFD